VAVSDGAIVIGSEPGLLRAFAAPAPRYTSYPTAPHFHAGIDATDYRRWLGAVPPGTAASAYLHIPFCDTLCWFCGCHTRVLNRSGPLDRYVDALAGEIEAVARRLPTPRRLSRIHLGGGSPTLLSPAHLARLDATLRRDFEIVPGAEIAVEIDPRGLTPRTVAALARFGVTRASIGVQDFGPRVQRAINRVQTFEETAEVAAALRAEGIAALNIDLMYGLPHQTTDGMAETVRLVLALAPARIAVFGYAHLPRLKRHQALIDAATLPGEAERYAQARRAADLIEAAGFVPIGFDHYALPGDPLARAARAGTLRRNFQGYTDDAAEVLLGLGASAIGSLPEGYVQNEADPRRYVERVAAGGLATCRGIALDDEDRRRRTIIHRLMCALSVDLDAVAGKGRGESAFAEELARCRSFADRGLASLAGPCVRVSEAGRPFLRGIAAAFDRRLDRNQGSA
jgi:oxygen-independent coproporphyrinogen-3 oxidase